MGSTPPDSSFASLASCHVFRRIQVFVWGLQMDVNVFGDGVVSVMSEQPSWNAILTEVVVSWSGGGITYDRRTDLIVIRGNMTGQQYVNEILRPVVAPMANRIGQNFCLPRWQCTSTQGTCCYWLPHTARHRFTSLASQISWHGERDVAQR